MEDINLSCLKYTYILVLDQFNSGRGLLYTSFSYMFRHYHYPSPRFYPLIFGTIKLTIAPVEAVYILVAFLMSFPSTSFACASGLL